MKHEDQITMVTLNRFFQNSRLKLAMIGAIIAMMIVCCFGCILGFKNSVANASTHNEKYFKCIAIDSDDTLWSIAEANMTEEYESIDAYIDEVKSINDLSGDKIYNGATLVIPYYAAPM